MHLAHIISYLLDECPKKTCGCLGAEKNLSASEFIPSPSSQFQHNMLQCVSQGPIAQWLEPPAHNPICAHVLLHTMPTEVGGTEVRVPKAGSYLDGKPEGDNSMACKSLTR